MIKIRLSRIGTKNKPFYRIIAIDERKQIKGQALEIVGYWHPSEKSIEIDKKKVNAWINKGAQMSPAVKSLMEK